MWGRPRAGHGGGEGSSSGTGGAEGALLPGTGWGVSLLPGGRLPAEPLPTVLQAAMEPTASQVFCGRVLGMVNAEDVNAIILAQKNM